MTSAIAAVILAFASVQVFAAPLPQLAGEGAAANSILSGTDNAVGFGIKNAEDKLAGNVATVKGLVPTTKRQLAGEGAAANSILSGTDNAIGYDGAQAISNAAGTGSSTSAITNELDSLDGSLTGGAADAGAKVANLEVSTLEGVGNAVPRRRQADKICNGAGAISGAAGTNALTSDAISACDNLDGSLTGGAADLGAKVADAEVSTLEGIGSSVPKP
ncbi:hypothetical protein LTR56_016831 [Elasticomyces elasticus]|nr:hypothetical protein LTR56_016831 [Elasticomyces elasticus]KAK3644524.1 hypothetical protein LTR22_015122 [Elasticomyces elasticus]KAK4921623.1 hypothetical protein LTR49_010909 [Elasticomyces elasticus]KAK5758567.1 hypothetical protein LTS12_011266 [Elasticomyces elasticus]